MVLSMDKWSGKVAVVTGASAGIGAAVAKRLVEEGLLVIVFKLFKNIFKIIFIIITIIGIIIIIIRSQASPVVRKSLKL